MLRVNICCFIFLALNVFGGYAQEVLVYTDAQSQHPSVKDFNSRLTHFCKYMEQEGLKFNIVDLSRQRADQLVPVIPSIFVVKESRQYWYKGRYNLPKRIASFAKSVDRFDFKNQR